MVGAFRFKQFTVEQDQCAMKIGTDGVLLGAWVPIQKECRSILDIGAGTGVISLMMAQRSSDNTIVDAIEIDPNAYHQCKTNFYNAPWSTRLTVFHNSLQEYGESQKNYDLIVSNPPFYAPHYKTEDKQRNQARYNDALPFAILINYSKRLLTPDGQLAIILPYEYESEVTAIAQENKLYTKQITRVRGKAESPIKRSMLLFVKTDCEQSIKELVIEIDRHKYTEEYIALTKEFYLKM